MPVSIQGRHVTFVAPAGASFIIGDFTDDKDRPIAMIPGQSLTLEFPPAALIEYCFLNANGQRFSDPDNSSLAENPWWREYRSVQLPGYEPQPFREPLEGTPTGTTESLAWDSQSLAGKRRAYVYLPANFDSSQTYPIFLVQDGVAYRRTGKLSAVMENLVHLGRIRPAILCFLEPHDRDLEYYFNDAYLDFVLTEVLPQLETRYPIAKDPSGRGLWGASLGGLASLWAAMRAFESFGMVVTQSGAFQGHPGTAYKRGGEEWLTAQLESRATLPLRFSMDCGQLEWLLGTNRRFAAMLWQKDYAHQYFEHPSGHNWSTWRNGLAAHLEWHLGTTE
jgi:enterochelin esterase-like enzyme